MVESGIYEILNKITDKIYIGSSNDIYYRWSNHKSLLKRKKHHNKYLQHAWNKYGEESFNFSLLENVEIYNLESREQFYIDTLKPEYNLAPIANSMSGYKHNEEFKIKARNRQLGKNHSEERKRKISITAKNNNAFRKLDKWPCPDGSHCSCKICRRKRTDLELERMKKKRKQLKHVNFIEVKH